MTDTPQWIKDLGYKSLTDVYGKITNEGLEYWLHGYHSAESFEKIEDQTVRTLFKNYYDAKNQIIEFLDESDIGDFRDV